ncbi:MAG TPA: beta-galactosidase trimerization domain-containing protein [Verrucomicrobiae bacterium]|mgnify:CR=1 FL=1|nr:beta-galactosidase trimerization domain-containing protein [Verrucomicrobiae bacterium]
MIRRLAPALPFLAILALSAPAIDVKDVSTEFELPFRQVHLDFHTSEDIPDVGKDFDPDDFATTLHEAHVNSVTVFGRCHHGWIYYDTKLFPERKHPNLKRPNLLKEQIEACHKRGIRAPVYVTVQWDRFTTTAHPEWVMRNEKGEFVGDTPGPIDGGFYRRLCLNSPYVDFLKKHLAELFQLVPVDGLFLDIVDDQPCHCDFCKKGMAAEGFDVAKREDVARYARQALDRFRIELTHHIRSLDERCTIFYNAGHIGPKVRPTIDCYTHFEMESLPSGGWGYTHFPLSVRYVRTLGKDSLGMTGKFHTSWGDFHSYKNPAALQFECFQMLALGAKCSIGDQLHPSGRLDAATYKLIGSVYAEVEKKESWCRKAKGLADVAVLSPEEFVNERVPEPSAGVVRMLQEGRQQFDILDSKGDFSPYKVLILPDAIAIDEALATKITDYLEKGGSLIASYESGLDAEKVRFLLPQLGVTKMDDSPLDGSGKPARGRSYPRNNYADYIKPQGRIGRGLEPTEHVMYIRGLRIAANDGAQTLAPAIRSYFDRTPEHFSSHKQTPSSGEVEQPAIVRKGRCIYFAHPIFTQYCRNAPRWCRVLFLNALDLLLPEPLLRIDAPTTALATINVQAAENRWVLHLLHYIPERRGKDFDVIEDIIPLADIKVSVHVPSRPSKITAVPQGEDVPFTLKGDRAAFTVPKFVGHQMIAIQF